MENWTGWFVATCVLMSLLYVAWNQNSRSEETKLMRAITTLWFVGTSVLMCIESYL